MVALESLTHSTPPERGHGLDPVVAVVVVLQTFADIGGRQPVGAHECRGGGRIGDQMAGHKVTNIAHAGQFGGGVLALRR